jgi:hypothetical protein
LVRRISWARDTMVGGSGIRAYIRASPAARLAGKSRL